MRIMEHKKLLYLDTELDARLRALALRRHEKVSVIIRDTLRIGLAVTEGKSIAEIVAIDEPPPASEATP